MHATQQDCQVLVVGAGPTGLVLAAELLARGIRTRVIDQGDGVALQARAIGIHARTLEVLDTMGLAGRFTECGQVVRQLRFYSRARCLTSLDFARCGSRFGYVLDLPQDQTERLLRARIAELGGAVEQRAKLTRLAISADDHGRLRRRLRRRAQPGPARARPDLSRAALPAGLAARRRAARR
jgi:2-polyprenyl-6-methoxyphenol hydroxylase-like FAD-dependent oxidoreductase